MMVPKQVRNGEFNTLISNRDLQVGWLFATKQSTVVGLGGW